jgi:serine/threonine protein kinase
MLPNKGPHSSAWGGNPPSSNGPPSDDGHNPSSQNWSVDTTSGVTEKFDSREDAAAVPSSTPQAFSVEWEAMTPKGQVGPATIVGDYQLERMIGQGGMGAVFSGTHHKTGERAAIKILSAELLDDPTAVARFLREAKVASKLRNPHTVRVLDVGKLSSGLPFIVMELLEGDTLFAVLRDLDGTLPAYVAIDLVVQACEAVGEAHAAGIVHRDLKLGNLFMTTTKPDERPFLKVLDFGLAKPQKHMEDEPTAASLTQAGAFLGTPHYMAPEQILGVRNIDARADVWALGVCLYCMIAGTYPFDGEDHHVISMKVLRGDPEPPSAHRKDLAPAIEAIILKCLSPAPASRYANATELAQALRAVVPSRSDLMKPTPDLMVPVSLHRPSGRTEILKVTSPSPHQIPVANPSQDGATNGANDAVGGHYPESGNTLLLAPPQPRPPAARAQGAAPGAPGSGPSVAGSGANPIAVGSGPNPIAQNLGSGANPIVASKSGSIPVPAAAIPSPPRRQRGRSSFFLALIVLLALAAVAVVALKWRAGTLHIPGTGIQQTISSDVFHV